MPAWVSSLSGPFSASYSILRAVDLAIPEPLEVATAILLGLEAVLLKFWLRVFSGPW